MTHARPMPPESEAFARDGFSLVRGLAPRSMVQRMRQVADEAIVRATPPVEFEAEVSYPGAPPSTDVAGGRTLRRVLQVVTRDPVFMEWACYPEVVERIRDLLGPAILMPLAHHNCIMVKDPSFSSDTGWHQDFRFWSFQRPELISVLLALDESGPDRGALRLIPGTHRRRFRPEQIDEGQFLRTDDPENRELFAEAVSLSLEPGDVLFFHCLTFHAASRNRSPFPTRSLIMTYRSLDNPPIPRTRSSRHPELLIPPAFRADASE